MLATASTIAAISTVSSPARQSRDSIRNASRSVPIDVDGALVADEPARGQRQPPRAARRETGVVRDEEQRRAALAIQPEHEVGDFDAGRVVEIARRLVGHQQLRLAGERAGDRDALLLAAGELLRIVRRALREPDAREPLLRLRRRVGRAGELERQHHVLERRQRRQQLKRLEDEAEQPLAQRRARILVQSGERDAVEPDVAVARAVEPGEQAQQRRLARTGRADDGDRVAGFDVEADVVEDRERRVAARHDLGQPGGAEDAIGHGMMQGWGAGTLCKCPPAWARRHSPAIASARRNGERRDGSNPRILPCRSRALVPATTIAARLHVAIPVPLPMTAVRFARAVAAVALVVLAPLAPVRADALAPVVLVVGDSISAAYGLPPGAGWVDLLSARLASERYPHRVVNASITGDTTAGGRARLPALLARHKPAIVVIELGGNDGLRGGNLASTRDNLDDDGRGRSTPARRCSSSA